LVIVCVETVVYTCFTGNNVVFVVLLQEQRVYKK